MHKLCYKVRIHEDSKDRRGFYGLREIGKIYGAIRDPFIQSTKPGITTKEIDEIAGEMFEKEGAQSAPKEEYDFQGIRALA